MAFITSDYYKVLCEAVEEVADELEGLKNVACIPVEVKERFAEAAISILRVVEVRVDVEEEISGKKEFKYWA